MEQGLVEQDRDGPMFCALTAEGHRALLGLW
jgi:hypothetical protein